jgi:hypothetical protein
MSDYRALENICLPSAPYGFDTQILIKLCYSDSMLLRIIKYFSGTVIGEHSAKFLFLFTLLVYFKQLAYKTKTQKIRKWKI